MTALPEKKYSVILADPPWSFKNKKTGGSMKSGAEAKYAMTPMDVLCALPVDYICEENCVLFMWWVGSQPEEALRLVKAWGFTLKTMTGFNWVKLTKITKELACGMGFWTRAGSECCLIATRGKPKRADASVRSVLMDIRREHSRKPDDVRERIVQLCGDVPRIELFARERVPGWDSLGYDIDGKDIGQSIIDAWGNEV